MTKTPIRCKRCGTLTTWTPYCPGCGAYLEFVGDPPWVPEPKPDVQPDGDSDTPPTEGADSPSTLDAPEPTEAQPSDAKDIPAPPPDEKLVVASVRPKRAKSRFGGEAPWWRFWGREKQIVAVVTPVAAEPDADPDIVIEGDEEYLPLVKAPDVPEFVASESPARQGELQRRTLSIGRISDLGVVGGVPCPRCRFRNGAETTYCGRCGFSLRESAPTARSSEEALKRSEDAPRRKDWTLVAIITVLIMVLVVILFAPLGEPIRNGSTNMMRNFAYWINPGTGSPATVSDVTATSTGYGSPPVALSSDLSTFWASGPSTSWGVGTEITFTLQSPAVIDRMVIRPGIQNGIFAVRALATPENLSLTFVELSSPSDNESPSPTASPTASPTSSPSASPSVSPSVSPSANPSPTPSSSSPSPTPSSSPSSSPTPTPIATPTVRTVLPLMVDTTDWTSIITFPAVYTQVIVVRVDSIFPPAIPDVYDPQAGGQVAISDITFLPQWKLSDLFNFTFQFPSEPVPTTSPSASPSTSPLPTASPSQPSQKPSPSG